MLVVSTRASYLLLFFFNWFDILYLPVFLGNHRAGLNMTDGVIGDMWELGVRESFKSKLQVRFE